MPGDDRFTIIQWIGNVFALLYLAIKKIPLFGPPPDTKEKK